MRRSLPITAVVLLAAIAVAVVVAYAAYTPGNVISNILTASITAKTRTISGPSRPPSAPVKDKEPRPEPEPTPPLFADIKNHWAEEVVKKMVALGIISGYPDGTFRPDASVTKAEFCKILVLALKLQPREGPMVNFADDIPAWARPYIQTAAAKGLFQGYPDGTFGPNERITRQEMAVVLAKAVGGTSGSLVFTDTGDIADWARDYVGIAVQRGLLKGYPDGTFKPNGHTTRAEACMVLWRLISE